MKVYLPEIDQESDEIKIYKPNNEKEYLQNKIKKSPKEVKVLVNKQPVWDDSKIYFLLI